MIKKAAPDVRHVLAENLRALMRRYPDMRTQTKVAKRAGIAQTSVSNMLNPRAQNEKFQLYPKLDQIEKVANAFGLAVWQILLDTETVGETLGRALSQQAIGDEDVRLRNWSAASKRRETA